jgi:hypothetical protein
MNQVLWFFTRQQAEEAAGRKITDEEAARIAKAIGFSTAIDAARDAVFQVCGDLSDKYDEHGEYNRQFITRAPEDDPEKPVMTYHVENNITGARVSKDFPKLSLAEGTCRSLNLSAGPGGLYGVYDKNGKRP